MFNKINKINKKTSIEQLFAMDLMVLREIITVFIFRSLAKNCLNRYLNNYCKAICVISSYAFTYQRELKVAHGISSTAQNDTASA